MEGSAFPVTKGIAFFDLDGTLTRHEFLDELARVQNIDSVEQITEWGMNGLFTFEESLTQRIGLLRGTPMDLVNRIVERIPIIPKARETFQKLHERGYRTVIVTGSFTSMAQRFARHLNASAFYANDLHMDLGVLHGVKKPILGAEEKKKIAQDHAKRYKMPMEHCIAIGDGANDIPLFQAVGTSIAFNPKPGVADHATHAIHANSLDAILPFLDEHEERVFKSPHRKEVYL